MKHMELSLASLKDLDGGRVALAFQEELAHVVRDCQDRPADSKDRKILLEIRLRPHDISDVDCTELEVEAKVYSAVPKRQSKTYTMNARRNGRATFHPDSPEDPDANLLFDDEHEQTADERKEENS